MAVTVGAGKTMIIDVLQRDLDGKLRVGSLRGRTGDIPELPDGAVVTGVTTTGSAIVGAAVTINASGVDAGAGIITTSFVGSGEGLTGVASTDNIITGTAATFTAGVNISGSSNVVSQ